MRTLDRKEVWQEKKNQNADAIELSVGGKKMQISRAKIDAARNKVVMSARNVPIEKMVSYGFTPTEIAYLEKKVFGLFDTFGEGYLIGPLEKKLGMSKDPSDLEKAYFKLKLKELLRVGYGTDLRYYDVVQELIENIDPLDAQAFAKLEFYAFWFQDFLKIKSDLLPFLSEIIEQVEQIYNVPAEMSEEIRQQVADHLRQELIWDKKS